MQSVLVYLGCLIPLSSGYLGRYEKVYPVRANLISTSGDLASKSEFLKNLLKNFL